MCNITFDAFHKKAGEMFKIQCCNGSRKCRVFLLAKSKHYKSAFLKIGRCSKCKRTVALIERVDFNDKKSTICRYGLQAWELYESNIHNIICECVLIQKQSSKVAWTYYKVVNSETCVRRYMDESGNAGEKIHSPVKIVESNELHNHKSSICKKCS